MTPTELKRFLRERVPLFEGFDAKEIGRIVGCSREMVGRVLKDLEERSLVQVKGKTMVVYGTR